MILTPKIQGLGWQVVRNLPNGQYALVHEGGEWGVSTIAILLPEASNGIIVFTNGDRGDEVYSKVVKEYLDGGSEIVRNEDNAIKDIMVIYQGGAPEFASITK